MKEYRKAYANKRVTVMFTPSEYKEFVRVADKEGMGVSTVVRNMALAYQQSNTLHSSDIEEELKELNRLVRNVANNVNQVAHRANIGENININEVLAYIKQLDSIVREHTKNKLKDK